MSELAIGPRAASSPATVRVDLGTRSYDVVIGERLLQNAGVWIRPLIRRSQALLITDRNLVEVGLATQLEAGLEAGGISSHRLVVPPGEGSKSFAELERLLDGALAAGIERATPVIVLGGGVVGDLGGLAASLLLRGLDLIQVPTTLLAQVDSSVGGKTGIDTRHGKNLIGTFHQPRLVLADIETLSTLPKREVRTGYAEVVKYGLIDRPEFFTWLEAKGAALLEGDGAARLHAVAESCQAKAEIVAADEQEGGRRALLNLGHTFAHALETLSGYGPELRHGEAVACGLVMAFGLSVRLGLCPPEDLERVCHHLEASGLPTRRRAIREEGFGTEPMLDAFRFDKKARGGRPRFVLVRGIGRAFADVEVDPGLLRTFLDAEDP